MVDAGVRAGMRDGVSGKRERTVDGLPWEESARVLRQARAIVLAGMGEAE